MRRKRVGVLLSGRGSNMAALAVASRASDYPAEIIHCVSNRADAPGLALARSLGLSTHVIEHRSLPSREAFDETLFAHLASQSLDLIACAGFMRVMTEAMIRPWQGRLLNIHPSLLPLYKGLHTHERALANGDRVHGCTVHFVSAELDGGDIIAQAQVPVLPGDTPDSLAARVLKAEHQLYPSALAQVAHAL